MIISLTGAIARLFLELLLTTTNIETPLDSDIMIVVCDNQTCVARIL